MHERRRWQGPVDDLCHTYDAIKPRDTIYDELSWIRTNLAVSLESAPIRSTEIDRADRFERPQNAHRLAGSYLKIKYIKTLG
jgi:hypothetical protein